jgi:hypothetical protein
MVDNMNALRASRTPIVLLVMLPCGGLAQDVAQPSDWCTNVTVPNTAGWQQLGTSAFVFSAPARFTEMPIEGVDSQLGRWAAPDSTILESDVGTYTGHFLYQPGVQGAPRILALCRDGTNGHWPQIVLYEDFGGRYAAGLWWPRPNGRVFAEPDGRVRIESLYFTATSADSTALGELLAIVRSIKWSAPSR